MTERRVPRPLGHQLDRLARRAHRFHRWSHHPLCTAYAGEVVQLGRRARVCRGCALALGGAAAGVGLGLTLPTPPVPLLVASLVLALPVMLAATARRTRSRRSTRDRWRPDAKILTRALPALAAVSLALLGLRARSGVGLAVAAGVGALAAAAFCRYRRRGPDRDPCLDCPERNLPALCAGFRPIARREAAFGRAASRLLTRARAGGLRQAERAGGARQGD